MRLMDIGENALEINDILREMDGELTPELEARLDALLASGKDALDAAAWVLRSIAAEQELCEAEAKRYKERAGSKARELENLKGRMMFVVDAAFGGKLKTAKNTIWTQASGDTLSFDLAPDADLAKIAVDNSVFVRREYSLDKVALKNHYQAGDEIPHGIVVTENPGKRSLRVK
jgi:hypothetical protein